MKDTAYYQVGIDIKALYKIFGDGVVRDEALKELIAYEPIMYALKHKFYPYTPQFLRNPN